MVWSLELSYGTPYLLSMGLSPQTTALVWLAGPISGLIPQPLVGHLSDECSSVRWRRRGYMLGSTVFIVIATLLLAYALPIAEFIVDFLGIGLADWDPVRAKYVDSMMQDVAVYAFWLLDISLNAFAAAARALILDKLSEKDVDRGNAWQGRMTHIGNIVGYLAGYLNLSKLPLLKPLGGGQFRKLAIVALVGVVTSVGVTCVFIKEGEGDTQNSGATQTAQTSTFSSSSAPKHIHDEEQRSWIRSLRNSAKSIWTSLVRLPRPIRRVCLVQVFSFMAWFPHLFYSSTYIGTFEPRGDSQKVTERRQRKGTEGLLLFAILALIGGSILPLFSLSRQPSPASRDRRQPGLFSSHMFRWRVGSTWQRRWKASGITLRTFWTASCLMHCALFLVGTFFVSTTKQAVWLVALSGIPWSISCWVPYTLIMSFVQEAESGRSPYEFPGDYWDPVRRGGSGREEGRHAGTDVQNEASRAQEVSDALESCGPLSHRRRSQNASPSGNTYVARGSAILRRGPSHRSVGASSAEEDAARTHVNRVSSSSRPAERVEQAGQSEDDEDDDEQASLLRGRDNENVAFNGNDEAVRSQGTRGKGGTILGIHNIFIVIPQLIVSVIAAFIFSLFEKHSHASDSPPSHGGGCSNNGAAPGVVWVLRFGGACMLLAALCTRLVPLIESERKARRRSPEGPLRADECESSAAEESVDR